MQKENNTNNDNLNIDLNKFVQLINEHKLKISFLTALIGLIGFLYINQVQGLYKSNAILSLSSNLNDSSKVQGIKVGGFQLGGSNTSSRMNEGITVMRSYDFFKKLISKNEYLLVSLLASSEWNDKTLELSFNQEIYNLNDGWRVNLDINRSPSLDLDKAYKKFKNSFQISINSESFLELQISHISPFDADLFVTNIIELINTEFSNRDVSRSKDAILFLTDQLAKTNNNESKQALSSLLEEEMKKMMLAQSSENYLFEVLEPSRIAVEIFYPNRIIFTFSSFLAGFLLSLMILLIHYSFNIRNQYYQS